MTCIVGIAHDGMVTIGGDSAATNDANQQTIRVDPKVFSVGKVIFGCTSSFRMTHLLHYSLEIPAFPLLDRADALEKYLVTNFIDAVRKCLSNGGYAKKKEEREEGGTFLVGIRSRLFCVDDDYQVEETLIGYNAVGSGGDPALGSLYTTQSMELSPRKRLEIALEAAAYHNSTIRPPFLFVTTKGAENEE